MQLTWYKCMMHPWAHAIDAISRIRVITGSASKLKCRKSKQAVVQAEISVLAIEEANERLQRQVAYKVLETTKLNQYWSRTVMANWRLELPTGQGVAYHCTCHLPLPLMAWSMKPCAHSGHLLVTKAVCLSGTTANMKQ